MSMLPFLRKFALTAHITFSVGWIGAVIAYLALVIAAVTSQGTQTLSAAWVAMGLIGRYVIVPLSIASLLSGVVMSLGTRWGLFRHYWVLFSLGLTVFATAVLLTRLRAAGSPMGGMAAEMDGSARSGLRGELLHAGAGLLVLLVIQILNVYKPRGITRYGWAKQRQERRMGQPPAEVFDKYE